MVEGIALSNYWRMCNKGIEIAQIVIATPEFFIFVKRKILDGERMGVDSLKDCIILADNVETELLGDSLLS